MYHWPRLYTLLQVSVYFWRDYPLLLLQFQCITNWGVELKYYIPSSFSYASHKQGDFSTEYDSRRENRVPGIPDKPGDCGKALSLAETEPQLCQVFVLETDCGRSESPLRRSYKVFGFLNKSMAVLQNNHLLFHELRSLLGRVAQKGQTANCTDQDSCLRWALIWRHLQMPMKTLDSSASIQTTLLVRRLTTAASVQSTIPAEASRTKRRRDSTTTRPARRCRAWPPWAARLSDTGWGKDPGGASPALGGFC